MKRAFRLPWNRRRIDAELAAEFQFHLQERVEQFIAAGMSRAEAEIEARRRFGDFEAHRALAQHIDEETMRHRSFREFADTVRREVRLAARVLLRTPGFAIIALVTLSLGIGASTAIFTVLDAVVLRPLPYPEADRLVSVLHPATVPGNGERKWGLSFGGFMDFRANAKTLGEIGIYRTGGMPVIGGTNAEIVRVAYATPSIFSVLRARPELGRLFGKQDELPDTLRLAVLSHEFWQRRFGSDPAVVGKPLMTGGASYRIIGVTQPGLTLPMPGPFASTQNLSGLSVDVWLPVQINPAGPFYNNHPYVGLARLAPGATAAQANAEIALRMKRFSEILPTVYSPRFMEQYNFRGEVAPLKDSVLGPSLPRLLWAVFGSVVLVLLIAVANVANLFVVRMDTRRRESTIRTALGADRTHMAAHYLSESLLLCLAAAAAGVLLSAIGLRAMLAIAPQNIPRLGAVTLSWQSVAFAAGLAAGIGTIFGLMPLLRRNLDMATLREGGRGLSVSRAQRSLRQGLIVAQMAFALILLASAGLMIRSFMHLRSVKPGLDPSNVLAFDISLPFSEYDTREKAGAFHRELQRRIGALPGVVAVGGVTGVPLDGGYGTGCSVVFRENKPYVNGEDTPCVSTPVAAPGFFEALRIEVRGRTPTWRDFDQRTQAVVITRALGDRLWPGEDPIGKGIATNGSGSAFWYRIVGVIPELRAEALDQPPTLAVFYAGTSFWPDRQDGSFNDLTYLVRTESADPLALVPTVRRVMSDMNPRVPFVDGRSMDMIVAHSMQRTSFVMILLGISAAVALLLSAVGIYGVISYVVAQRRFEIGVRIALGARVSQVAGMVLMQSVRLAVIGVSLGLAGTWAVTSLLRSLLFGVSAMDPVVLGLVTLSLLGIATLASFAPARRASRIDPVEALRG
jgi:predicted permease